MLKYYNPVYNPIVYKECVLFKDLPLGSFSLFFPLRSHDTWWVRTLGLTSFSLSRQEALKKATPPSAHGSNCLTELKCWAVIMFLSLAVDLCSSGKSLSCYVILCFVLYFFNVNFAQFSSSKSLQFNILGWVQRLIRSTPTVTPLMWGEWVFDQRGADAVTSPRLSRKRQSVSNEFPDKVFSWTSTTFNLFLESVHIATMAFRRLFPAPILWSEIMRP